MTRGAHVAAWNLATLFLVIASGLWLGWPGVAVAFVANLVGFVEGLDRS